jgi:signal transduction histidine kinase
LRPNHRHGQVQRRSRSIFFRKLVEAFDLDGFLPGLASLLLDNVPGVDSIVVFLYDDSKKQLVPVSVSGCSKEGLREINLDHGGLSVVGKFFETGRTFLRAKKQVAKVVAQFFYPGYPEDCRPESLLCIPMVLNDGTRIGCLLFLWAHPNSIFLKDLAFFKRAARMIGLFAYKAKTLAQSQEKKHSNLVCTLSHELRTPLTCIKGYATTLLNGGEHWSPDEQREFLKIIDSETNTMKELIDDLLESSMIESGLLSIRKEPVLLQRIVGKAVDDARLRTAKHNIVVSMPADIPVMEADPGRTRQVLDNLLDNAIKYSPDGGLIVIQCNVGEKEVTLSVADEGMGIAPEHLNRLFEKFYRVKSELAGTGLGLPVAREIVEKQGGRIWARSAPGKGSTFYFTLPLAGASYPDIDEDQSGVPHPA